VNLEEALKKLRAMQQEERVDELLLTTLLNSFPLNSKGELPALTEDYLERTQDGPEYKRLLIEAVELLEGDKLTLSHITSIALLEGRVREQVAAAREVYSQAFD
jgi:hypothetical protein